MTTVEIRLDRMSNAEYKEFEALAVPEYAEAKERMGTWAREESLAKAQEIYGRLLPNGLASPNSHLFTVRDAHSGQRVGRLWFAVRGESRRSEAYIYDIAVAEEFRGQGYGRATLMACIEEAAKLGAKSVGLHVFGDNAAARSLYTSLGFAEVGVTMSLPLDAS
ncbi:GNAT family N-acetyltransferase (plasmid) [Streptomyces sp. HUAS TT11]|uniref:GNAT family N-acetyltransferase n=1 Tax=Streptomyces sp. HUAS TT11 TaxID=3447508 RepID=UPI003F65CA98